MVAAQRHGRATMVRSASAATVKPYAASVTKCAAPERCTKGARSAPPTPTANSCSLSSCSASSESASDARAATASDCQAGISASCGPAPHATTCTTASASASSECPNCRLPRARNATPVTARAAADTAPRMTRTAGDRGPGAAPTTPARRRP